MPSRGRLLTTATQAARRAGAQAELRTLTSFSGSLPTHARQWQSLTPPAVAQQNNGGARQLMTQSNVVAATVSVGADGMAGINMGSSTDRFRWQLVVSSVVALAVSGSVLLSSAFSSQEDGSGGSWFNFGSSGGAGGGGSGMGSHAVLWGSALLDDRSKQNESDTLSLNEALGRPGYDISVRAMRGMRAYMEDEYFIGDGGRFAAVFDGHGGGDVSLTLRNQLYKKFRSELAREQSLHGDEPTEKNGSKILATSATEILPLSSYVTALRSAFAQVEDFVTAQDSMEHQGSTAVAVLIHEAKQTGQRTLLSANVGDSRAVLSRQGEAIDLTEDHKPDNEKEKARILGMGEMIEWDHYCRVHRVNNLAVSRSIGDRFAKPAVSPEVEMKRFPMKEDGGDEFVVLASDGLWDVMESQEVVDFIHAEMEKGSSLTEWTEDQEQVKFRRRKNMSRFVANEAYKRGSSDNISVVIVWLDSKE